MSTHFDDCTGQGVRVLVIDSGVDDTHPALLDRPIKHFVMEREADDAEARVVASVSLDPIGHGTAVASIIRRYAPNAELSSVAVLGRASSCQVRGRSNCFATSSSNNARG